MSPKLFQKINFSFFEWCQFHGTLQEFWLHCHGLYVVVMVVVPRTWVPVTSSSNPFNLHTHPFPVVCRNMSRSNLTVVCSYQYISLPHTTSSCPCLPINWWTITLVTELHLSCSCVAQLSRLLPPAHAQQGWIPGGLRGIPGRSIRIPSNGCTARLLPTLLRPRSHPYRVRQKQNGIWGRFFSLLSFFHVDPKSFPSWPPSNRCKQQSRSSPSISYTIHHFPSHFSLWFLLAYLTPTSTYIIPTMISPTPFVRSMTLIRVPAFSASHFSWT